MNENGWLHNAETSDDCSATKGPASASVWSWQPPQEEMSMDNIFSMSKEVQKKKKKESNHGVSQGARGHSCLGRRWRVGAGNASGPEGFTAGFRPPHGRGLALGAMLMLGDGCLDHTPQTSCFPGTHPMVPTCWDGMLPGMMGRKAPA